MNSVAHQLRRSLKLFMAAILLYTLIVTGMAPRALAAENHAMHTKQHDAAINCAASCARTVNVTPTTSPAQGDQSRIPDPQPPKYAPYYLQSRIIYAPKKLSPGAMYSSMPSRPPDIVKLSGHLLF